MRRPRPFVPLTSAAAAVIVCGTLIATQATDAQPGAHEAVAATRAATAQPAAAPRTATAIDAALTKRVKAAMAKATAGRWAAVVDVEGVGRVVDVNGSTGFLPASTEKLYTTLPLLLDQPQQRFTTTVASAAAPVAGIVQGDLVVHASADPTMMGVDLESLATQVHDIGVRRVTGRLVLDTGGMPTSRTRQGWKTSYVPGDVPPLSPIPVHYDVWKHTSSYYAHPTGGNLALLRDKLTKAGVAISGGSAVASSATADFVLATRTSPTMASLVSHTLHESDNFFAEQMLSHIGWAPVHAVEQAAHAAGSATDGSGLSLKDRRTAHSEVNLLEYAHGSSAAQLLVQSLPVACTSGTLKHEMCKTVASGRVFAKTGTLDHVKALAGYTTDAQGRWVTFSFLTSGDRNTYKAMLAIDHAVVQLCRYGS